MVPYLVFSGNLKIVLNNTYIGSVLNTISIINGTWTPGAVVVLSDVENWCFQSALIKYKRIVTPIQGS